MYACCKCCCTVLFSVFLLLAGCRQERYDASHAHASTSAKAATGTVLVGTWRVDSLSLPSVGIPSFCKSIGAGATFEFTSTDSLRIYQQNSRKPCETYAYSMQHKRIHIVKSDMNMLVTYEILNENTLKLTSQSFFRRQATDMNSVTGQVLPKEGIAAFLSRRD